MPVTATSKKARVSPRKAGVVAALVRGRSVADALVILEHTPRRSAKIVLETVKSAKANAEHNHQLKPDTLVITEISVTHGPRYKRVRPSARLTRLPYQLKTSHIRVVVDGQKREIKKPTAKKSEEETK